MHLHRRAFALMGLGAFLGMGLSTAHAAEKLSVLIIDGQNNHDWKAMTPEMKAELERTGRFSVDVATSPPKGAEKAAWSDFRPKFSKYDVVLSNYNGEPWPDEVQKALEDYVGSGGGLVVIHAANNAFAGWPAWNEMIGLGWRDNKFGERVTLNDSGEVVHTPKGEGPGSGHGPQHEYQVTTRDANHPITKGLPKVWKHAKDELYHGQRGPAKDMHILATAYSSSDKGGTGTNEPMLWWIPYGKGRVVTCLLGHTGGGQNQAIRCVGFKAFMDRACEWAATGEVTLPAPKNFPTADETSVEEPLVK